MGRARRNAALLTCAATRQGPWRKTEGWGGRGKDIYYQREQVSALSSRPSAARVWDQGCPGGAMEGAAGRRGLPGTGWLPERPRSASLIASLTAVPPGMPHQLRPQRFPPPLRIPRPPPLRRRKGSARAPRPQRFPRSGRGAGLPVRGGLGEFGRFQENRGQLGYGGKNGCSCFHMPLEGCGSSVIIGKRGC